MSQFFPQCTTSLNARFFFLNLLYIVFVGIDSDYFNICTYRQVNNILLKVRSHVYQNVWQLGGV